MTMSGLVISTSTSGFDTWLAKPLPITTDSYLREKIKGWVTALSWWWEVYQGMERFYSTCFWLYHSSTRHPGWPCLQHRLCLEVWTRTSWRVWASSWRPSTRKRTQCYKCFIEMLKRKYLDEVISGQHALTNRSKLVPAAVVGLASGL